jgi:hypothetical protein
MKNAIKNLYGERLIAIDLLRGSLHIIYNSDFSLQLKVSAQIILIPEQ